MAYLQSVRNNRIYRFQDTVDLRLSISIPEGQFSNNKGRSLIKLRLELLSLSPSYKGFCIEQVSFRLNRSIRLEKFNRLYYSGNISENKNRVLSVYIDNALLNEAKLNGIVLSIDGYLLCANHSKDPIFQKFVVFERPAIIDSAFEKRDRA